MEPWNKAPEKVLCSRVSFAVNIKTPSQQTTCRMAAFVAASKFYFQKAGKTIKKKKDLGKKKSRQKQRSASAKTQHKVSYVNSTCTFIVPQIYLQQQIQGLHYTELSAGY